MIEHGPAITPSYHASNPIKRKLALAQLISTQLSFKIVLNLFFRPIHFSTPEREVSFKQSCILNKGVVNNKRITIYQIGQSAQSILLVHGWSGRPSQFYALAPELEKEGYKVYMFTAPAHGNTEDTETHMLEFADCITYLDENYGPFEAIIGHSLGGMAILNAINQGVATPKVVLLGVPGYIKDVVADFSKRFGLKKKVEHKLLNHLSTQYGGDIEAFSTTRLAAKMNVPGLIIHDVDDQDVDIEFARQNHKEWPQSKLIETNGLGHRLILTDANVIKKIKGFILD